MIDGRQSGIVVLEDADEDGPWFQAWCSRCDAQGPIRYSRVEWISETETRRHAATGAEAIAAWNRRTLSD